MIALSPSPQRGKVRVTFSVDSSVWADRVSLVGEFNGLGRCALDMEQDNISPHWHVTLELDAGCRYYYGYLVDGEQWTIDRDGSCEPDENGVLWAVLELRPEVELTWIEPVAQSHANAGPSRLMTVPPARPAPAEKKQASATR